MTHTTVTAAEMKALEKAANDNGLLYIQMMENAGRAAFAQLRRRLPGPARLLVAAGRGNNGGDGFVAGALIGGRGRKGDGRFDAGRTGLRPCKAGV